MSSLHFNNSRIAGGGGEGRLQVFQVAISSNLVNENRQTASLLDIEQPSNDEVENCLNCEPFSMPY